VKVQLLSIASCYCLLLCCRGDHDCMMARRRDGSVRLREESAGRTSLHCSNLNFVLNLILNLEAYKL